MSLAGFWQLAPVDSSLQWPVVDFPASLRIGGSDTLEITYTVSSGLEEIAFYQQTSRSSKKKRDVTYVQRGKLNYQKKGTVSCVISSDRHFTELCILHMGPRESQRVKERYKISSNSLELVLDIVLENPESKMEKASVQSFTKRFVRTNGFDDGGTNRFIYEPVFPREIFGDISNRKDDAVNCLKSCSILIADTVDLAAGRPNELIDGSGTITYRYEGFVADEAATLFIVRVVYDSKMWNVYRRYREFNAIQSLFKLYAEIFRDPPKFPSKSIGRVTGKNLIKRKFALNTYINHFVQHGGYGVPNLVDTLFAFLEIPVHVSSDSLSSTSNHSGRTESFIIGEALKNNDCGVNCMGKNRCKGLRNNEIYSIKVPSIESNPSKTILSNLRHSYARSSTIFSAEVTKKNWEEISETTKDWHSVMSEVSAPDYEIDISASSGRRRLLEGIVVIKHGRKGAPKTRLIKLDYAMDRLYWLDVADAGGEVHDPSKSIALNEVVNIRLGVKYIRNEDGSKECVPNLNKVLNNKLTVDELKLCLSIQVLHRCLDIQCVTNEDHSNLHSGLLSLISWCV